MQNKATLPFNQKIRLNALKIFGIALLPVLFLSRPIMVEDSIVQEIVEVLGVFLAITAVLGRLWATLYVGGRKNKSVVTDGPYSISRNPLYLFSTIGTLGVGLMFGMFTLAIVLTLVVGTALYLTARKEQAFLEAEFGDVYKDYAARVPMFFPDIRLFHTAEVIEVRPKMLRRNLRDAFIFLLAFPLFEIIEVLRDRVDITLFSIY